MIDMEIAKDSNQRVYRTSVEVRTERAPRGATKKEFEGCKFRLVLESET